MNQELFRLAIESTSHSSIAIIISDLAKPKKN